MTDRHRSFTGRDAASGLLAATFLAAAALSSPAQSTSPASRTAPTSRPAPAAPSTAPSMEVAAFYLQGKLPFHRVHIADLDMMVVGTERYLPLRHILKALELKPEEVDGKLKFVSASDGQAVLDPDAGQITIDGKTRPIDVRPAEAPIAGNRDYFVPMAEVGELIAARLEWQAEDYQVMARTDRALAKWQPPPGSSLLAAPVIEVPDDLPEMFKEAQPPQTSLDFVETRAHIGAQLVKATGENPSLALNSVNETFWGRFAGGAYKISLAQPDLTEDQDGFTVAKVPPVSLSWGDLTFQNENSELAIGDSAVGLSDLAFPIVRLTGLRYNAMLNAGNSVRAWNQSGLGSSRYFAQMQEFQGFAEIGSHAELYVNDRKVAEDDVKAQNPAAPLGQGLWRFRDIQIPSGTRNEIRIVITSPAGIRTQIERSILGTSFLVPQGATALLAIAGVNRDATQWRQQGFAAGVRALHGVSSNLTVGATLAYQEAFNLPLTNDGSEKDFRQYPLSSTHATTEFTYLPFEILILKGEIAESLGEEGDGTGSFSDTAACLQADLAPLQQVTFHQSVFRYGPDYFNGVNTHPRDREGYVIGDHWKISKNWTFGSSLGWVTDNVDKQLPDTLAANFQSARLTTTALPRSTLTLEYDRIASNQSPDCSSLYTVSLDSSLPWDLDLSVTVARGGTVSLPQDSEFFTGINVPDLPLFQAPAKSVVLRKLFRDGQTLALSYQEGTARERLSLIHNIRLFHSPGMTLRSEFGQDLDIQRVYFDQRTELALTSSGQTRLGFELRLQQDVWACFIYLDMAEVFANHRGHFTRINDSGFLPDLGAVQGTVFRDVKGNGVLDPGAKGVPNVRVSSPTGHTATTDANGYYILQTGPLARQDRVFLEVKTVPADLSPFHAVQSARVVPRAATEVNLAVGPLHAVTGNVFAARPKHPRDPISGVRVFLTAPKDQTVLRDSFTANDGSYYLGSIRPGDYVLHVDKRTLPSDVTIEQDTRTLRVEPKEEAQELAIDPFTAAATQPGATQPATTEPATTQPSATQPAREPTRTDTTITIPD